MANDNDRGEQLYRIAGIIAGSGIENAESMAHDIRKYVKLVVDRDIGPTNEVRALNTALMAKVEELTNRNAVLAAENIAAQDYLPAAVRMSRKIDQLKAELAAAKAKLKPLEAPAAG